jgi:hypothetical protein
MRRKRSGREEKKEAGERPVAMKSDEVFGILTCCL